MLDLQPLIARFVDDVLRTIRSASIDELRALLGERAVRAPVRAAPRKAPREAPRARKRAIAKPPARVVTPPVDAPDPPAPAEITDPEALLAAASASLPPAAPEPPPALHVVDGDGEAAAPPSGERSMRSAARLRAGETLAREAGNGVIIRRAKRA